LADVFVIQSEIAKTIAEQLRARLSPIEQAAIAQKPTTDLVAYDLYLQARVLADRLNDPGAGNSLLQAVSLLEEAVRRDPNFLLAYCLLCETHLDLFWGGFDHTAARRELANAALQEAERIESDAGEVHVQKGLYAYRCFRDYDRARAELALALRTLPNASRIYLQLGAIDRRQARWDETVKNFHRAAELDPKNFLVLEETAFTHTGLRQFAEGKTWYERALAISSKDYLARTELSQIPFYERADTGAWRSQLNAIYNEGQEAASHIVLASINFALAERDRHAADEALALALVLLGLALGAHLLVAGELADALLHRAGRLVELALDLFLVSHCSS
jgi:tetratricopeptide (TPR) repeat protein